MIFFTDENISHRIAPLLEAFDRDNEIRSYYDHFKPGKPDTEWLGEIATWSEKPTVLCGDGRILRNKAELVALREANLMFVLLAKRWMNLDWNEQAWKIIQVWPRIVDRVSKTMRPSVFQVSVGTMKVELVGVVSDLRGRS